MPTNDVNKITLDVIKNNGLHNQQTVLYRWSKTVRHTRSSAQTGSSSRFRYCVRKNKKWNLHWNENRIVAPKLNLEKKQVKQIFPSFCSNFLLNFIECLKKFIASSDNQITQKCDFCTITATPIWRRP